MAKRPRTSVPNIPYHVTQRGNRRQLTFFSEKDYEIFRELLIINCKTYGLTVHTYCFMPNHTHLIVVPEREDSLRLAIGEAHRQYSVYINRREGWTGCLWQGRFWSCPLDERHLIATTRYVEQNPVRAGICSDPFNYRWNSAKAHLSGQSDGLVRIEDMARLIPNWRDFLNVPLMQETASNIRQHTQTGRPLGDERFVQNLEAITGKRLRPKKKGRKPSQAPK